MAKTKKEKQADEIIKFLTSVMNGEIMEVKTVKGSDGEYVKIYEPPSVSVRQKAAELLGKRISLFDDSGEQKESKVIIYDDIEG